MTVRKTKKKEWNKERQERMNECETINKERKTKKKERMKDRKTWKEG